MRVYKGLVPCSRILISNLDNMGKRGEAAGLHDELECRRASVQVVGAIERLLWGSDRITEGDRRIYVRGASLIKKSRSD